MSFTELMVTVVILAFGVLGLAATADSAQRALSRGRRRTEAANRAAITVDSLRGQACRVAGANGVNGQESWSVEARESFRYVTDSVQANGRQFTVEGAVPCP